MTIINRRPIWWHKDAANFDHTHEPSEPSTPEASHDITDEDFEPYISTPAAEQPSVQVGPKQGVWDITISEQGKKLLKGEKP